jgi:surfactin synthase thioesterase subunit/glycosyltransferase involved in cell wall biosynthesis
MRILLAHNSLYYPAYGGGDRSNRLLMEALAARGHSCRVVARLSSFDPGARERYLAELAARSITPASSDPSVTVFDLHGVQVHIVTSGASLRAYFAAETAAFAPDIILSSTDDPAHLLLEAALRARGSRVVFLARATLALPFGPDCAFPSPAKTDLLRQADRVVAVSRYVASYIRRWGGIDANALPISLLDPGPYPSLGRLENEYVTLVNPCAVKGISIFLALADQFPNFAFAAVPTWGTNPRDRAALAARPNIHLLDPFDNIDDLFRRTRVLLVPSLWAEARSRIVVEAMLRGVPVLASDIGGIPEAKLGVPYLLPVHPIEKYDTRLDEQMVPAAVVPEQDATPWATALSNLLSDPAHYQEISGASREAALAYAASLDVLPFERALEETLRVPRRARAAAPLPSQSPLDQLSPEKRRLLALRLSGKRTAAAQWFPSVETKPPIRLRLFCFPHAGGGAAAFLRWAESLPAGIVLSPVRLPGRESRLAEPPFCEMAPLVAALGQAIEPFLAEPFAFYGHSMGAVVAFELARRLRARGLPLPQRLFVSAARAPQFRKHYTPPPVPDDAQFIAELRRLEGVPAEVLANEELMQLVLPALRADSALFRNYLCTDDPPLPCPIRAYGGLEDPNVTRAHLEAWAAETTASFALEMFPGGHFFIDSPRFLSALARDLCP